MMDHPAVVKSGLSSEVFDRADLVVVDGGMTRSVGVSFYEVLKSRGSGQSHPRPMSGLALGEYVWTTTLYPLLIVILPAVKEGQ